MKRMNALATAQQFSQQQQPQGQPQMGAEQRMRQYDMQHGVNPDQAQVSEQNDMGTNYRIIQQSPTDANVMMFEQLYGSGQVSPFQSYEQNRQGVMTDSDAGAMNHLYGTGQGGPHPNQGYATETPPGPSQYAYEQMQRMMKR